MDDVQVLHRHARTSREMQLVRSDRIDHLVVATYRCSCGSERAILSTAGDGGGQHELLRWPFGRAVLDGEGELSALPPPT